MYADATCAANVCTSVAAAAGAVYADAALLLMCAHLLQAAVLAVPVDAVVLGHTAVSAVAKGNDAVDAGAVQCVCRCCVCC